MADDTGKTLWVAVIGAGPAGYYTAEALTKNPENNVCVDILDRLPTPYGLIRAGVAPDHQSIKNVSRRYEKTNNQESVRFVGNLSLGRDITLKEVMGLYDAVVLATGAPKDRELGLDGEDLDGVIGSGAFVSWYNSHPDFKDLNPNLNIPAVAVVGNGNVAVDVARVLAKTAEEMSTSDLADHASDRIHGSPIRDIYILGRRGPLEASFTPKELGEMNNLDNAVALMDPAHLPDEADLPEDMSGATKKNLKALKVMTERDPSEKPVRIHLAFYQRPMAIIGETAVEAIRLERTEVIDGKAKGTGDTKTVPVGMVVPCIGYRTSTIEDVPYNEARGHFDNEEGLISDRLYCVGWAKRGPTGTIGTNKPDGAFIANRILDEVTAGGREGHGGLDRIAAERNLDIVTFRDWKKIEAAEEHAADDEDAPRIKFADVDEMIQAIEMD